MTDKQAVTLRVSRIVLILFMVMITVYAAGKLAETALADRLSGEGRATFYVVRLFTTAALMTALTVFLMIRYRRQYEHELRRQSEEAERMRVFFENIIQDAGEAIISLDNEGIIRTWNRAAERIYGYSSAEILGQTFHRLIPEDLLAAGESRKLMEAVRKNGYIRNFETRRVRKDGGSIVVRVTRSLLRDGDGRVIGTSAIVSDITSEKEMEARLIQAEKLAAIGQAAASTAHEVRNALAGIWGTISILERTRAWEELPDDVGEEVKRQIARIAHIIDDLLSYARPGRLDRRCTDIHEVLERARKFADSLPEAEGRRLVARFCEGALFADVDAVRLEQAFQNLIANSCQAMEPGGVLTISTNRRDGFIEMVFADNGRGMSPETLSHALEPFFTTKARGTGLGLAIVRTIVEAHHGGITLSSAPGEGTRVTITLPGRQPETAGGLDPDQAACSPSREASARTSSSCAP